jgi:hypothetical protein
MVAVKNIGKVPAGYVRRLSAPGQARSELTAAFRGPMRDLRPDGYRLVSATFDTNLCAVRLEMEFQSERGPLHFAVASFLTEKGVLEFSGMARPSDYPTWAGTFDAIIASVHFSDWLQYHWQPATKLSVGTADWLYPIAGVALVIAGGWVYIRFLRRGDSAADY